MKEREKRVRRKEREWSEGTSNGGVEGKGEDGIDVVTLNKYYK